MSPPSMTGPGVARRSGNERMFGCREPSIGRFQANRCRCPQPDYQVGRWVWLSTQNLKFRLPCRKLSPWFIGPFRIEHQSALSPTTYSSLPCIASRPHFMCLSLSQPTPHLALKSPVWNCRHLWKSMGPPSTGPPSLSNIGPGIGATEGAISRIQMLPQRIPTSGFLPS